MEKKGFQRVESIIVVVGGPVGPLCGLDRDGEGGKGRIGLSRVRSSYDGEPRYGGEVR